MAATIDPPYPRYATPIHPLHAVLLAGSLPLFLGAALSDIAYFRTYEIQWNNFASWLIVGGLVLAALALVFAVVDLFRAERRTHGGLAYLAVLVAAWVVGFFNALMHARDAWASMPTGLVLSLVVVLLAAPLAGCQSSPKQTQARLERQLQSLGRQMESLSRAKNLSAAEQQARLMKLQEEFSRLLETLAKHLEATAAEAERQAGREAAKADR